VRAAGGIGGHQGDPVRPFAVRCDVVINGIFESSLAITPVQQNGDAIAKIIVRYRNIIVPVAVEIADDYSRRAMTLDKNQFRVLECAVALAEQDADVVVVGKPDGVGYRQVEYVVMVKIASGDAHRGAGQPFHGNRLSFLKLAVDVVFAIADQDADRTIGVVVSHGNIGYVIAVEIPADNAPGMVGPSQGDILGLLELAAPLVSTIAEEQAQL